MEIKITNLTKHYGKVHAVDGLDFTLSAGKVTALVGPNGAGKSTLLRLLSGREEPDEGDVTSRPGVFAGGDAVTGSATVILAMGAGKAGAKSIDEYIKSRK